ncbi:MAG: DedA family protein [bacterium]|nr:DedA family protein [bacterium]
MEFISGILTDMGPHVHFISFGLLLLAGFNFPVSEDLVFIVTASIAATLPEVYPPFAFAGCFLGAFGSDIISYHLGKYAGNRVLRSEKEFKLRFLNKQFSPEKIKKMEGYFERYGSKTLFFGRFIPFGVRNMLFMTSGFIKMELPKFMIIDFLALCVTSAILFTLGYHFEYKVILPYLDQYKYIIFGLFIAFIVIVLIRKRLKKKTEEYPK